jgi:hypothetical protein
MKASELDEFIIFHFRGGGAGHTELVRMTGADAAMTDPPHSKHGGTVDHNQSEGTP